MTRHIRFSLDLNAPPTVPDRDPLVKYGVIEGDKVFETQPLGPMRTGASFLLRQVRRLPPCWPSKIVCVGRNYHEHAKELGNPAPSEPVIFLKPPSSLIANGDAIVYPRISQLVSYEGELGLVIGRRARNAKPEHADSHDLQRKDTQWTRGKGFDTFCPAGPWIVPREELILRNLRVRTYLDGALKQDGLVRNMIFSVGAIIAFVTQFMTLEPGDLIATGTPSGVGPMQPGSEVRVEVEGIGALQNKVVKG
jgi:2-keto-4-pentenoate hydratase/2-oxohepta-3-ene-1,7-dioic acid hydratase in catechol pathway